MKKYCYLITLFFATSLVAQEWQTSYTPALAVVNEQKTPMLLVFAGSDWCAPCIKMDKNIWRTDVFRTYAKDNLVLYKADFPRKKANRLVGEVAEENKALAEKYNPKGHFPFVLLLNTNGNILGQTGYHKSSPEEYIELLKSFTK